MDSVDPTVVNGVLLGALMISLIILPYYCCQVSDSEYEEVVNGIREAKRKINEAKNAEKEKTGGALMRK